MKADAGSAVIGLEGKGRLTPPKYGHREPVALVGGKSKHSEEETRNKQQRWRGGQWLIEPKSRSGNDNG